MNMMPINASSGTKVIFAFPDNGWSGDKASLQRLGLKEGDKFTVDRTEIHQSATTLFLCEFPGERFNTVNFSLASECQCDMRTKLVGDGCEVCKPAKALEYAYRCG